MYGKELAEIGKATHVAHELSPDVTVTKRCEWPWT